MVTWCPGFVHPTIKHMKELLPLILYRDIILFENYH